VRILILYLHDDLSAVLGMRLLRTK